MGCEIVRDITTLLCLLNDAPYDDITWDLREAKAGHYIYPEIQSPDREMIPRIEVRRRLTKASNHRINYIKRVAKRLYDEDLVSSYSVLKLFNGDVKVDIKFREAVCDYI